MLVNYLAYLPPLLELLVDPPVLLELPPDDLIVPVLLLPLLLLLTLLLFEDERRVDFVFTFRVLLLRGETFTFLLEDLGFEIRLASELLTLFTGVRLVEFLIS